MKKLRALLMLLIFIILELQKSIQEENSTYRADFQSLKCVNENPDICKKQLCYARPTARGSTGMTIGCTFEKPIYDVMVHSRTFYKFGSEYRQFLIDLNEDYCDYFTNTKIKGTTSILYFLLPIIKNRSDIIYPCPVKGEVYVRDYSFLDGYYPNYLPSGDYYVDFRVYRRTTNETMINWQMSHTSRPKRKENGKRPPREVN